MKEKSPILKTIFLMKKIGEKRQLDLWIFSSSDNIKFNYNSKYLFLYVKDNYPDIKPRFVINDPDLRKKLSEKYGEEYFIDTTTKEGICTALLGSVWFTSASLPVYGFGLNKKRLIINLWHGVPLKKIALCDRQEPLYKRTYFKKVFSENYTDVAAESRALIPVMQKSFDIKSSKVKLMGQPRLDVLFDKTPRPFPVDKDRNFSRQKRILYAPTFRKDRPTRIFPFDDFDKTGLNKFLEEKNYVLYIRTHMNEKASLREYLSDRVINFDEECAGDVTEYLSFFDLLITDYSSIFIDYLLLERPVIFLPYDIDIYKKEHGFNFPYEEIACGQKPSDFKSFLSAAEAALEGWSMDKRQKRINDFFHEVSYPCSGKIVNDVLKRLVASDI